MGWRAKRVASRFEVSHRRRKCKKQGMAFLAYLRIELVAPGIVFLIRGKRSSMSPALEH